jgi:hypothetical protein
MFHHYLHRFAQVLVRKGRLKKIGSKPHPRNCAGRFQLSQTRRVLSGVKNAGAKFPPSAVKVKKRHF